VTTLAAPTRVRAPRPPAIIVTEGGVARIAALMAKAPQGTAGVRLTTPKRGCSGLAYDLSYVAEPKAGDEAVPTPAGTLFVDGGSLMYLIGSTMDWREDDFTAGFVFENPNAKGACGCGESFTV
jgi:iron-sulfur cluster assembly protein